MEGTHQRNSLEEFLEERRLSSFHFLLPFLSGLMFSSSHLSRVEQIVTDDRWLKMRVTKWGRLWPTRFTYMETNTTNKSGKQTPGFHRWCNLNRKMASSKTCRQLVTWASQRAENRAFSLARKLNLQNHQSPVCKLFITGRFGSNCLMSFHWNL